MRREHFALCHVERPWENVDAADLFREKADGKVGWRDDVSDN